MLIYGEYKTIGTPENKQLYLKELGASYFSSIRETTSQSSSTSSGSTSSGRAGIKKTTELKHYLIIVKAQIDYDPSSEEKVVAVVYKEDEVIGSLDLTFYPSGGTWHPAKNRRMFAIPLILTSRDADQFSLKVFDTSGNSKTVSYISLTTEVCEL